MIYAFKREGDRVETLERHVNVGLRFLREIYLKRGYGKHVALRLDLSIKEAEYVINVAYAMHDLGKAYSPYHELIVKGHGAPGHEVISAYVILQELLSVDDDLRKGMALAVLLHHHAMRTLTKSFDKAIETSKTSGRPFTLRDENLEDLNRIYSKLGINLSFPKEISKEELQRVYASIRPTLKAYYNARTSYVLAYLILHPLSTSDVLAAITSKYGCNEVKCLDKALKEIPEWLMEFLKSTHIIES